MRVPLDKRRLQLNMQVEPVADAGGVGFALSPGYGGIDDFHEIGIRKTELPFQERLPAGLALQFPLRLWSKASLKEAP